jgi:hypothetical protein
LIIEHSFVTTRDSRDALRAAGDFMSDLGFDPCTSEKPDSAEWSRGKPTARKARRLSELPQRVRLEFDRGRVALACSVEFKGKPKKNIRELMIAHAVALEDLLAGLKPPEEARAAPVALWTRLKRAERLAHRISVAVLILFILGVAAGLVALAASA